MVMMCSFPGDKEAWAWS